MKWLESGPKLSDRDFKEFEQRTGYPVPYEARWFYRNVVNGGYPEKEHYIEVSDQGSTALHHVQGINHPRDTYNVEESLECTPEHWVGHIWPLANDDWGCPFLLMLDGPNKGAIEFIRDRDYYYGFHRRGTHLVAKDIFEFADMLDQPSAIVRDSELRTPQGIVFGYFPPPGHPHYRGQPPIDSV